MHSCVESVSNGICRTKDESTHSHSYNGSHHSRGTLGKPTNRSMNSSGLDSNFTMMEADRVFGRTSEWSTPADVETGWGACLQSYLPSCHANTVFPNPI